MGNVSYALDGVQKQIGNTNGVIMKYVPTVIDIASNVSASLRKYAPEMIGACSSISTSVNTVAAFAEENMPAIEKSLSTASEALATIADLPNNALASSMDRSVATAASSLRGLSDFTVVVQVNIKTIAFGAVIVIAAGIVLGLFLSNYIFTLNPKQNLIYLGIKWLIWLVKLLWTRCHRNKEEKKEVWANEKEVMEKKKEVLGTKAGPRIYRVVVDDARRGHLESTVAKSNRTLIDDVTTARSQSSDHDENNENKSDSSGAVDGHYKDGDEDIESGGSPSLQDEARKFPPPMLKKSVSFRTAKL
jgi:hypothetical protein